jgi:spermidine synthase
MRAFSYRAAFSTLLLAWLLAALPLTAAAHERLLLEKKSMFGSIYVTEDHDGLRTLRFERYGARQSVVKPGDPMHLELRYLQAMPLALALVDRPRSALVIGLGGGSLASFLHHAYPEMKIDVVDIDPVVVEAARSHFGFKEDARLKAHVADGRQFIEQSKDRYDIVFLDGFGADSVPDHLTTREFITAVRNRLAPGGLVASNLWGRDANRKYDSMVKTYRSLFPNIQIVDVVGSGNKILLASEQPARPDYEIVARARALTQKLKLKHDLGEIANQHMRPPGIDGETGEVLTDVR